MKEATGKTTRREFMKVLGAGAAAGIVGPAIAAESRPAIVVDPKPKFELSPYLYMQFMEPLGTTDSSVDAAWDFTRDCWREDVVEVLAMYVGAKRKKLADREAVAHAQG